MTAEHVAYFGHPRFTGDFFGTILTQTAHCAKGNTSYINE